MSQTSEEEKTDAHFSLRSLANIDRYSFSFT